MQVPHPDLQNPGLYNPNWHLIMFFNVKNVCSSWLDNLFSTEHAPVLSLNSVFMPFPLHGTFSPLPNLSWWKCYPLSSMSCVPWEHSWSLLSLSFELSGYVVLPWHLFLCMFHFRLKKKWRVLCNKDLRHKFWLKLFTVPWKRWISTQMLSIEWHILALVQGPGGEIRKKGRKTKPSD